MTVDDKGPMSVYAADRRRPGFAEQFRRLEAEWPTIIGTRPPSDQRTDWRTIVRPWDVRGTNLLVISNRPDESIRVFALPDAIIARARAIGLVEIESLLVKPIARGSYQDAVDDIRRRSAAWTSIRASWPQIADGRGRPTGEVGDALIIEIDGDSTNDVRWFGQHQATVVRAVQSLGLEHISMILLRPAHMPST